MNIRSLRSPLAAQIGMLVSLTLVLGLPLAFAGKKPGGGTGGGGSGGGGTTTPAPPTPANFRVTAVTAYTISVAWDPAPATSGDFNYYLSGAYQVTPATLPKTATSHTFTGLAPGNEYWLFIYTKDAAGNAGGQAQVGPIRLPNDTTAPWTAPVVSVGEIGANYAHISWTRAADDGPYHYAHEVWLNGSLLYRSYYPKDVIETTLRFLQPDTRYSVQVRTYDFGNNPSPLSDPVSFRTLPANPNDTSPPGVPANVFAYSFGDLEMSLSWTQSTDNFDAQANIRYDVYVNGRFEDVVFGSA
ncbi:MAG TPA: fibronectin type III domain-containing protein, partial [Verrucomicrobiae bacterium]|nr:fibronectin type III domain-containing protein [Verrucomicrobiae bacterium]